MDGITDKELFDASVSDAPVEVKAEVVADVPQETPADTQQGRDENGRFAPKQAETAEKPAVTADVKPVEQQDKEALVPSWRLREIREASEGKERQLQRERDEFAQQLADLRRQSEANKPKQEPADFFSDPNAAIAQTLSPIEQQMRQMQSNFNLRASKAEALAIHGKDAVAEMETAIGQAMRDRHPDIPALRAQMQQSDDPVGIAMSWYQRDKLLKETGGDLTAYNAKTLENALNNPEFLAKALEKARGQASGSQSKPNVQLPPSLNRASSAGSPHEAAGDLSDGSLYSFATR